jgi:transposase
VAQARIVLAADTDPELPKGAIASWLGVSRQSLITWRGRFLARRLTGLVDAPRSGALRQVSEEAVKAMITRTLKS